MTDLKYNNFVLQELLDENKLLKDKITILENEKKQSFGEYIDKYIDTWFENNKSDVDIGVITIFGMKVDLLPDYIEKYIYKKFLKILFSLITDLKK